SWVWGAFGVLVLGMVLVGILGRDGETLYQALKILVIGILFLAMWRLVGRADAEILMRVLYGALALLTLTFFLSKAFAPTSYRLGAWREGEIFAHVGVLWKAGAFFLPLFMADWLRRPDRWAAAACAMAACVYLVVVDGSRTGLLLVVIVFLAMGAVLWFRGDWHLAGRRPWALPLVAGVLLALLVLGAGMGVGRSAGFAPASAGGAAQAEALMSRTITPLTDSRLDTGDAPRLRLLSNGLQKSWECFPLGCGFGSTRIDPGYGIAMEVHNAYIGALADFGLLGLLGMLGFVVAAVLPMRVLWDRSADPRRVYFVLAVSGSALAYCAALALNTFSTEMSEWGYLILMLAFAWQPVQS
ncbi:MAG: hypothetical protein L0H54_09350, partial [Alcaligenaceae bacterium]|nr:hypothetical protein [Alcaligenaceae bacterium]